MLLLQAYNMGFTALCVMYYPRRLETPIVQKGRRMLGKQRCWYYTNVESNIYSVIKKYNKSLL